MKKKKILTVEQQLIRYKKRFHILLSVFILFMCLALLFMYANYDYIAFKHLMSHFYIYEDALDELYNTDLKRDVEGKYFSNFDSVVISEMSKAIRQVNNDRYTYLYVPEEYKQHKLVEQLEAEKSSFAVLNKNTLYFHLTNFSKYSADIFQENIDLMDQHPNIIIDLRGNLGGSIDAMVDIAGYFLPHNTVIGTARMKMFDWTYKSKKQKTLSFENIIVLQDNSTASASESFIAALKDNLDNVMKIGQQSYGKGIGQYTMPLKKGFAVKATILLWYSPLEVNTHIEGIAPDIYYDGDNILQFILNNQLATD